MSPERTNGELRVGVFVCDCGLNIAGAVDCGEVTAWAQNLPDVVCAVRNKYTCADPGQNEIKDAIHKHKLNRVAKARLLSPQEEMQVPVTRRALVIGGGVAGIEAALELAEAGHPVTLVEKQASIGGIMAQLDKTYPTMDCSI
jgi:heterodisulfide reductase subunit A-like polyferredoxin